MATVISEMSSELVATTTIFIAMICTVRKEKQTKKQDIEVKPQLLHWPTLGAYDSLLNKLGLEEEYFQIFSSFFGVLI